MRDFKGMKRQRGRNNRGGAGSGGKPQQHNANRAFDSNGPEGVKVRGAAQSVYEKYQQLARDATSSGDRVLAENYLQHAEHYFRVLRAIQPNRPVADIIGKDAYSAYEIDFEAEPEEAPEAPAEAAPAEGQAEGGEGGEGQEGRRDRFENRQRDDRPRDDRQRDNQNRDRFEGQGQSRRDRWRDRDDRDRNRDDRPRDDRPRDDRPREDRPVADGGEGQQGEGGGRRERRRDRDRGPRPERDPMAVIEPQASLPLAAEAPAAEQGSPLLRGQDGDVSHAPAFLGRKTARAEATAEAPAAEAAPAPEAAGEEVKKPRRRRAPRSFEGGEGAPASESEEV
ncbi:MAG: DUF4167 domain-containing protein [Caulobacter sp.]|nr:DUF4167 domain-containing protein [Caulobacter sp.]